MLVVDAGTAGSSFDPALTVLGASGLGDIGPPYYVSVGFHEAEFTPIAFMTQTAFDFFWHSLLSGAGSGLDIRGYA